jgi:hypothetical protein
MIGVSEFISDPNLLGPHFRGESWEPWRITLKAAFAEPMTDAEVARFRELAGREPPKTLCRELWCAIGRRAGKDSIASAIATHAAVYGDFQRHLRPGERAVILCLAVNRTQAAIVFDYIRGYFEHVPLLAALVRRIDADTIELTNDTEITVATNSYRSIRGRTVAVAIFDEIAFWRDETGANPDIEIYRAIHPALMTLRASGSMIIAISTVYRRSGLLYSKIRQHLGQDGDILAILQPSIVYRPTLDQAEIDRDLADDPERFGAEWLSQWRSDISDLFDRDLIEAAVDPGVIVRPHRTYYRYRAFSDPSGGRGDSFAAAIAHQEGNLVLLDSLYERKAPFDPAAVVDEVAAILREYAVGEITGDKYAASWCSLTFEKAGIKYIDSDRDKSAIFLDALPLFTSGRARLLDNSRLISQLCGLERKVTRTGRDVVSHLPGANDDVANAAAGALTLVSARQRPMMWREGDIKVVA